MLLYILKKIPIAVWLTPILVVLIAATTILFYAHTKAQEIGTEAGVLQGKLVGTAIGSLKGSTIGYTKGTESGKNKGLSAIDVNAKISGIMKSTPKLEVLVAKVRLKNLNEIGKEYKSLSVMEGKAYFTVDLKEAEFYFSKEENKLSIVLPNPKMELDLKHSSSQKLAEVQKFSWNISKEEAFQAYFNSIKNIEKKVEEKVANYNILMEKAKESAEKQMKYLVTTFDTKRNVEISFK